MSHADQKFTKNGITITNSRESTATKLESQYITQENIIQEFPKRNHY